MGERRPVRGRRTSARSAPERVDDSPAPAQRSGWYGLLLILAIAGAYSNSLAGPFVLDDEAAIATNQSIRELSRVGSVLVSEAESPVAGRPIVNLTFALNYAWGGLDVTGYHVVNIALHAACAVLLMLLCRRTLQLPAAGAVLQRHAAPVAFCIASIWALHPLNSEVVDYLSQRTESLMALCLLATLLASIRAAGGRGGRWAAVAVIACALGMLSKEAMVVAPVIVVVYDRVLLFDSWRAAWAVRRRLYVGLAVTWLVLLALIVSAPRASVAGFSAGVPVWTNLLNQALLIGRYLRLAVWPTELVAFYGWHQPLALGDVLAQALLIVAAIAATIVALRRTPLLGFAGAWFFITLAPTSSVVPIATEVGAERRMYLALAALVGLAVAGLTVAAARVVRDQAIRVTGGVVIVVAAVLGSLTYARNREYASGVTLAQTIVDRWPSGVAFHILGEQLHLIGRESEALGPLRQAVTRGNSRAGLRLGSVLFDQRDYPGAIDALEAFAQTANQRLVPRWLEPPANEIVAARLLMGQALLARGDGERAAAQADAILTPFPRHVEAHALLGAARFAQQRWADAREAYRPYLGARPNDVAALIEFGVASVAVGAIDDGVGAFQRAVAIEPGNEQARRLLSLALQDRAASASAGASPERR